MPVITPKEKAFELVQKYMLHTPVCFYIEDAKKCSLIAISEIVKNRLYWTEDYEYWRNVEIEINYL